MSHGHCTHEAVVLAADGVRGAFTTTDADDGDGGASETDEGIDALDDNTEKT